MTRLTVKLLLVDPDGRVLLVRGRDTVEGTTHWFPVGGGIEDGESPAEAAAREAREETGLDDLPPGRPVWTREARYEYSGRAYDVHETWLHHEVPHFEPTPEDLSDFEAESITGFRWWTTDELARTSDTVFPPDLGERIAGLQSNGFPESPIDIGRPGG